MALLYLLSGSIPEELCVRSSPGAAKPLEVTAPGIHKKTWTALPHTDPNPVSNPVDSIPDEFWHRTRNICCLITLLFPSSSPRSNT